MREDIDSLLVVCGDDEAAFAARGSPPSMEYDGAALSVTERVGRAGA